MSEEEKKIKEMEELGCEFLFQTRLEDVIIEHDSLRGVRLFLRKRSLYESMRQLHSCDWSQRQRYVLHAL